MHGVRVGAELVRNQIVELIAGRALGVWIGAGLEGLQVVALAGASFDFNAQTTKERTQ